MTSLRSIALDVQDKAASNNAAAMVQALQSVGQLMSAVQQANAAAPTAAVARALTDDEAPVYGLTLRVKDEWEADELVWRAIGQLPQLGRLWLQWDPFTVTTSPRHLSTLKPLAGTLRTLCMSQHVMLQQEPSIDYSVLGSFQHLAHLYLQLPTMWQGLHNISSCSCLEILQLTATAPETRHLEPHECAAIGQLTRLSELQLLGLHCGRQDEEWRLIAGLQQLEQLCIGILPIAAVATLATLKHLTKLTCNWRNDEEEVQLPLPWRCSSLLELVVISGRAPFEAFPHLQELQHYVQFCGDGYERVATGCTQLASMQIYGDGVAWRHGSFLPSASVAARTAALSSMATLRHLQHLHVSLTLGAEVATPAAFQCLTELSVVVPATSSCTARSFMLLAALRKLEWLQFDLLATSSSGWEDEDVGLLVSSVRHVETVIFNVHEAWVQVVYGAVDAAIDTLSHQGLVLAGESVDGQVAASWRVCVQALDD
jgi:hypothetical protein